MRGWLVAGMLLAVPVLGMVLPHFIIGDGVNLYEGGYRELAEDALLQTEIFFAGDHAAATITAKRVMKVGMCGHYPPEVGDRPHSWIQGEVQLYTIFGIPYGELRFQCEGTEQILCPQAGAECKQGHGASSNPPLWRVAELYGLQKALDERNEVLDG
jgi:hypothetical protein